MLFGKTKIMPIPQNQVVQYKLELLSAYLVSLGITFSDLLGMAGTVVGIVSTIIITYFLARMYHSQIILNKKKADEIDRRNLDSTDDVETN